MTRFDSGQYLPDSMDLGWAELSDEKREQQYSPSSCLPDGNYKPFVMAYRDVSDTVWADIEARSTARISELRYGPTDRYTIDVSVPLHATSPPLFVLIHGGYWQELSHRDSRFPAASCLDRGWAFAAVDYPLAPNASIDEIVDACCGAIEHLYAAASQLGFDPNRIIVSGSSAGAHLAAMVALKGQTDIAGTVLVSGVFELAPLLGTSINEAVGMDLTDATRNSPLLHSVDGFPPSVVAYGSIETDQFKAQSDAFADHLEAAGTLTERIEVEDRNHFDVVFDLVAPGTALGSAVASLIDSTQMPPAPSGAD